jgi:hypothetical protein
LAERPDLAPKIAPDWPIRETFYQFVRTDRLCEEEIATSWTGRPTICADTEILNSGCAEREEKQSVCWSEPQSQ